MGAHLIMNKIFRIIINMFKTIIFNEFFWAMILSVIFAIFLVSFVKSCRNDTQIIIEELKKIELERIHCIDGYVYRKEIGANKKEIFVQYFQNGNEVKCIAK